MQEQAAPGSPLDSYLYAYDGSQPVNNFDGLQALIASNDDSQGTLNSLISFNVTAGPGLLPEHRRLWHQHRGLHSHDRLRRRDSPEPGRTSPSRPPCPSPSTQ